ncbi:glycoside hydrolase superfamily [Aspergillus carlsbadensis]|nr:glycoside hydrolase superfamily [Aspergillus carlsbadensis]
MQRHSEELKTGWSMKEHGPNADTGPWLPVQQVPSEVHLDLLANKKIPDPFLDTNELAVQWVGEKDWLYKTTFASPQASQEQGATTALVFHGLDTFTTVTLNGTTILTTENMHIVHRVDVSTLLRKATSEPHGGENTNTLEITFHSALHRGRDLVTTHTEHTFHVRQTEASRVPVRKAQYHWGWDWGPILMSAGPWRPVVLETYVGKVEDVWVDYRLSEDLGRCEGEICARVEGGVAGWVVLSLQLPEEGQSAEIVRKKVRVPSSDEGTVTVKVPFTLKSPALWYPHGYGPQARYTLSAELLASDDKPLDRSTKLIGLRRAALIQDPDAFGKSFYFRINNIDIFAGGSCWIPPDSFLSRMTRARYSEWMNLLVESNQVMIRVWGGGIYEDDAFLDAADELGILVWQDFAFACASYPVFDEFLASVEVEARQNLRRFRGHPSVIVWAGNNEDYQVQERYKLEYNPEDTDPESWRRSSFPARYIYEYLLPKWVREEDPNVLYHPGSPWGDGKHSSDPTVGDIHQWNRKLPIPSSSSDLFTSLVRTNMLTSKVWHGQMIPYQNAASLSGRFVSEFGMQAYPHLSTIDRFITDPSQRHPGSMTMDFHNKAAGHARRLGTYLSENLPVPADLASYTHATQILQAETMRYAYKTWRRMWGAPGARQCGGVLVWQLNDAWPGVSWSVVDYYGVRKPAFYAIKRAMREVDVGISREGSGDWTEGHVNPVEVLGGRGCRFDVWVASSRLEKVEVEVELRFISITSGAEVAERVTKTIMADTNATTEILSKQKVQLRAPDTHEQDPFIIHAILQTTDGNVLATDTDWPQPLKYLDFTNRGVNVHFSAADDCITVSAERPVKGFVFEEREGLAFSDNGVDLVPGEEKAVRIISSSGSGTASGSEYYFAVVTMVCYLIINPDPRTPGNYSNVDGHRGFLVKIGDGELGDRYQVHNPTAYGVQNRNHRREDKFRHTATGTGIRANQEYALGKALEYQYFKWDVYNPARSEWHKVIELPAPANHGMALEELRQKLVRALELFPYLVFTKDLGSSSAAALEFDGIMDGVGEHELA